MPRANLLEHERSGRRRPRGGLKAKHHFLALLQRIFTKADAGATAVLVDELDAGCL
jgi:hypothetical protein